MPHVTPTVHTSQDPVITHVQNTSSGLSLAKLHDAHFKYGSPHYSTVGTRLKSHSTPPQPALSASFFMFCLPTFSLNCTSLLLMLSPPLALCCAAVSVVLKERRSKDSVTLAWQGPERPNGAIVEYEVIYYEKVRERTHTHKVQFYT